MIQQFFLFCNVLSFSVWDIRKLLIKAIELAFSKPVFTKESDMYSIYIQTWLCRYILRCTYLICNIEVQPLMYFMKTVTTKAFVRKKRSTIQKDHIFWDFNKSYTGTCIYYSLLTIDLSFIIGIKRDQQLYQYIT